MLQRPLAGQAEELRKKIEELTASLTAIEQLKAEVLQMQTVSFKKYADIIVNLQMKNASYHLIKRFDDDMLDYIRSRFDKENGLDFMERFDRISDAIVQLKKTGVPPGSERGRQAAKEYWGLIMEFTDGDMGMLPKLVANRKNRRASKQLGGKAEAVNEYIEPALQLYFAELGADPFQEVEG